MDTKDAPTFPRHVAHRVPPLRPFRLTTAAKTKYSRGTTEQTVGRTAGPEAPRLSGSSGFSYPPGTSCPPMGCIDGQQLEWDYDFGHYSPDHPDYFANRRIADMGIQQRMGLLSERWARTLAGHHYRADRLGQGVTAEWGVRVRYGVSRTAIPKYRGMWSDWRGTRGYRKRNITGGCPAM